MARDAGERVAQRAVAAAARAGDDDLGEHGPEVGEALHLPPERIAGKMRAMRILTLSCAALLMICAEARAKAPSNDDTVSMNPLRRG